MEIQDKASDLSVPRILGQSVLFVLLSLVIVSAVGIVTGNLEQVTSAIASALNKAEISLPTLTTYVGSGLGALSLSMFMVAVQEAGIRGRNHKEDPGTLAYALIVAAIAFSTAGILLQGLPGILMNALLTLSVAWLIVYCVFSEHAAQLTLTQKIQTSFLSR